MLRYYWLVLCKAFRPSWAVADTIGTVLGLLIPAIVKLVPEGRRETVAELVWEVPLSVLLTLFIVRVVMAPWLIHQEQESKLTDARKKPTDKTNELSERDRKIEAERTVHQTELHRARASDPKKNAIRSEMEQFIRLFEEMKSRASQRAIPAGELYPLESRADSYLKRRFAEYEHFSDEYQILKGYGAQDMVSSDVATKRCEARLNRLREALGMLS